VVTTGQMWDTENMVCGEFSLSIGGPYFFFKKGLYYDDILDNSAVVAEAVKRLPKVTV
jgi:hypothetical protein